MSDLSLCVLQRVCLLQDMGTFEPLMKQLHPSQTSATEHERAVPASKANLGWDGMTTLSSA